MLDTKFIENPLGLKLDVTAYGKGQYDTVPVLVDPTEWVCKYYTDQMQAIIDKLIPTPPQNLLNLPFSYSGTYSALQAGTGTSHPIVTDSTTFSASIANFYDGSAGTLTAYIDSVSSGSRIITGSGDTGTYNSLIITSQTDPYAGQPGKENFWLQLSANVAPSPALALGNHTYQLGHSTSGLSQTLSFWVDNPGTATISAITYTLPVSNTIYISGVPSLATGESITLGFTVNNAVGKHYNVTKLASIVSSYTTDLNNIAPPVTPPAENASVVYTNQVITAEASKYAESIPFTITGYNSKGVAGTPLTLGVSARIDTVSVEPTRRLSGSGQYPTTGYPLTFDSVQSLKTTYTEELQMVNGYYQMPTVSYIFNLPTNGPDYSSGMGALTRWCMPAFTANNGISISNVSSFTINIQGPLGTWSGTETTGVSIYAKVEGVTGWIDCNKAYPAIGSPSVNGDGALDVSNSSVYIKRVTFGPTPRTGNLYIRIGLPVGSDKKFTGITLTSVA